jgi:hypothetical protein
MPNIIELYLPEDVWRCILAKSRNVMIWLQASKEARIYIGQCGAPIELISNHALQKTMQPADFIKRLLRDFTSLMREFEFTPRYVIPLDAFAMVCPAELSEGCECLNAHQDDLREIKKLVLECPSFFIYRDAFNLQFSNRYQYDLSLEVQSVHGSEGQLRISLETVTSSEKIVELEESWHDLDDEDELYSDDDD